jgi:hypothetical protein
MNNATNATTTSADNMTASAGNMTDTNMTQRQCLVPVMSAFETINKNFVVKRQRLNPPLSFKLLMI